MKKIKNLCFLSLMGLGIIWSSCSQTPTDLTKSSSLDTTKKINSGVVSERMLATSVRLPGKLVPFDEVNIFPKVTGFVKKLYVDRGSFVKKGQFLIQLEAPEMISEYEAVRSKYLQIQENALASTEKYNRLKEAAIEPGAVSAFDLDNAYTKMKADQALEKSELSNVGAIKAMQEYLNIRAPFTGYISSRNISLGAYVSPGKAMDQPMLVLQDNQKLRLTVYVPENYVDKLNLKGKVKIRYNSLPGEEYMGQISRISHALGNMQSEAIEIDVENPKGLLNSGMYAEVEIPLVSSVTSLLVPNSSIVRSTENKYIIKIDHGKAQLTNIKEGLISKDSTEVFGNLKSGDKIVLKPSDEIKSGDLL